MKTIIHNKKKIRTIIVCSLIILFTINIAFNSNLNQLNQSDFEKNNEIKKTDLQGSYPDANGKPLLVHQYATITNTFLPLSLPKNVSFTLAENWIPKMLL